MEKVLKKCGQCGERSVTLVVQPYTATLDHEGRGYDVTLPDLQVLRCDHCGNLVVPDEAEERLENEMRRRAGLLSPTEIQNYREGLGLSQEKLAFDLGVTPETFARRETGRLIQQRSLDNFLRAYFHLPDLRNYLRCERPANTSPAPETTSGQVA